MNRIALSLTMFLFAIGLTKNCYSFLMRRESDIVLETASFHLDNCLSDQITTANIYNSLCFVVHSQRKSVNYCYFGKYLVDWSSLHSLTGKGFFLGLTICGVFFDSRKIRGKNVSLSDKVIFYLLVLTGFNTIFS